MTASPLVAVVIGVADLDRSLNFYCDYLGLSITEERTWGGSGFELHWRLPEASTARVAVVGFPGSTVGRVVLIEFDAVDRHFVRDARQRRFYGLFNLNFYCYDVAAASAEAARRGYPSWSRPIRHDLQPSTGQPTEVLLDGPDAVIINLVQLPAETGTEVGEMRRHLDEHGTTPEGFTEVSTSSHCVWNHAAALAFHRDVLGQELIIDETLSEPESNELLGLHRTAVTRVTFLRGGHSFGKVVLSHPVNYRPDNLAPRAVAPHIGYLAMAFEVDDLATAVATTGRTAHSPPHEVTLPGFGTRHAAVVRAPGSGALYQLIER